MAIFSFYFWTQCFSFLHLFYQSSDFSLNICVPLFQVHSPLVGKHQPKILSLIFFSQYTLTSAPQINSSPNKRQAQAKNISLAQTKFQETPVWFASTLSQLALALYMGLSVIQKWSHPLGSPVQNPFKRSNLESRSEHVWGRDTT